MSKDLWPDFDASKIINPKTIIVEQANFLGDKTKNVITAEVRTGGNNNQIVHSFDIVAPAMNNYRFNLFNVKHGIMFYPLTLSHKNASRAIKDEKSLIDEMARIFNLEETIKIISSLYSQSV